MKQPAARRLEKHVDRELRAFLKEAHGGERVGGSLSAPENPQAQLPDQRMAQLVKADEEHVADHEFGTTKVYHLARRDKAGQSGQSHLLTGRSANFHCRAASRTRSAGHSRRQTTPVGGYSSATSAPRDLFVI